MPKTRRAIGPRINITVNKVENVLESSQINVKKMERYLDDLLEEQVCPIHIPEGKLDQIGFKGVENWAEVEDKINEYLAKYNTPEVEFKAKMKEVGLIDGRVFVRNVIIDVYETDRKSAKKHLERKRQKQEAEDTLEKIRKQKLSVFT